MPESFHPRTALTDTPALRLGAALAGAVVRLADARDHRPLLTWVDVEDESRVELSAATTASWVGKIGGLLLDEHAPGCVVGLDLDGHWTAPLIALGAWRVGAAVTPGGAVAPGQVDLLVALEQSGAASRSGASGPGDDLLVVGPGPGAQPTDRQLPSFPAHVLAQPDELVADPPGGDAVAVAGREPAVELSTVVAGLSGLAGRRILVLDPLDDHAGLVAVAAAAIHGAAIVGGRFAASTDDEISRVAEAERVDVLVGTSARLRASEAGAAGGRAALPWPPPQLQS